MKRKIILGLIICMLLPYIVSPAQVLATTTNITVNLSSVINSDFEGMGIDYEPFMWWPANFANGFVPSDWDTTLTEFMQNISPSWARVMYNQAYSEPSNDNSDPFVTNTNAFQWNSPAMLSLYKYLDLAAQTGTNIMFTTDWLYDEPVYGWYTTTHSGDSFPANKDETAEHIVALLNYLKNTKGYNNIKVINIVNECNGSTSNYVPLKDIYVALNDRMVSAGIRNDYRLDGFGWTCDSLQWAKDNLSGILDIYDHHEYEPDPENRFTAVNNIVQGTKKVWMAEFGDYPDALGDGMPAVLKTAWWTIAGVNQNQSMMSYWTAFPIYRKKGLENEVSLLYFKNIDGKWIAKKQYYAFQLMSSFLRGGSIAYSTSTNNSNIKACTVKRNSDGKYTTIILNQGSSAENVTISYSSPINQTLYRYECSSSAVSGRTDIAGLPATASFAVTSTLTDTVPAGGFCVYTSLPEPVTTNISKVSATKLSDTSFNAMWHTNNSTDSIIQYGVTTSYGSQAGTSSAYVGEHSVNITGLTAGTLYHYRIKSTDSRGNITYSSDFTFKSDDTTAPNQVAGLAVMSQSGEAEQDVVTNSRLTLKWNNNNADADFDHYNVYMSTTSGFTPGSGNLVGSVKDYRYVAANLNANTTYYFKVKAVDKFGNEGAVSAQVSGTTLNTAGVNMTEDTGVYYITAPDYKITINKFFGTVRYLTDGDGYMRLIGEGPGVLRNASGTTKYIGGTESTVAYSSIDANHKRINISNTNGHSLQYDFYPDRIEMTPAGGGRYQLGTGEYTRALVGGYSTVEWSDGTKKTLNYYPDGYTIAGCGTSMRLVQDQSKRDVFIQSDFAKTMTVVTSNPPSLEVLYNSPQWKTFVVLSSGETVKLSFPERTGTYTHQSDPGPFPTPQPIPVQGTNMVSNPGFESGLASWTANGGTCVITAVTDDKHLGSGSCKVTNRSDTWNGPCQDITTNLLNGGMGNYNFKAWFKMGTGSDMVRLQLYTIDDAGGHWTEISADPANAAQWQQFTTTIPVAWTGTLQQAQIHAQTVWTKNDYYVDDIEFSKVTYSLPVAPTLSQLITNSGFEAGASQWSARGASLTTSSSVHSGSYSGKVYNRTQINQGPSQDIKSNLTANGQGNYMIDSWVKLGSGTDTAKVTVRLKDDNGDNFYQYTTLVNSASWTECKGVLQLGWKGTLQEAELYVETSSSMADIYLDDCILRFDELLSNSQFENGSDSWYLLSQDATLSLKEAPYARTGYKGMGTTQRNYTYMGPRQDIKPILLTAGQGNYSLKAYAKMSSGEDLVKLTIYTLDDTGGHWNSITGNANSFDFNAISGNLNITWTGALQAAEYYVETVNSITDLHVDDCSLRKLDGLRNGGFENGITGWDSTGSTIASDTSQYHSGSKSCKVTGREAIWAGPKEDVMPYLNTFGQGNYDVGAWVRMSSGTDSAKVTVYIKDQTGDHWFSTSLVSVNSAGWLQVSGTLNLTWTGTITETKFYVETTATTNDMYVDDCSMKKAL